MYFVESRPTGNTIEYYLSVGLRNVGRQLVKHPAVAVDVLVDNFSTSANSMDGHQWWTRSPEEWQPIGLYRTQKFHTWEDSNMILHAGTERCIISGMQFYTGDSNMGLRSARIEVFVYSSVFNGCAVLELGERDCIEMTHKNHTHPHEIASITGVADLKDIDFNRYATAPISGVISMTAD